MSKADAVRNLGAAAARRLLAAHKPIVRLARRRAREQEQASFRDEAARIDRELAAIAAGAAPIVVGPWLAEVGYEVLYWVPFLRWFCDAHRVPRERVVALSRGGLSALYADVAGHYVDIFDHVTAAELARRNQARQHEQESGGQKQTSLSALDQELVAFARSRAGAAEARLCHPSLMFRLFRHVWHGNLPMELFWRRTRYVVPAVQPVARREFPGLPDAYVALKLYAGPALALDEAGRAQLRQLVAGLSRQLPVVTLDTAFGLDEHRDLDLSDVPNVMSAAPWMTPRDNLDVQLQLIAGARRFVGSCGGLAWLAPFLGVPTVAIYETDRLLAPHLFIARQAGRAAGAAEFATLDLRASAALRPDAAPPVPVSPLSSGQHA